jgi:hypothetical protein
MPSIQLVSSFLSLMNGVDSLTTIQALAARGAEVIFGEELSLAGWALSPELSCVLPVQSWLRNRRRQI